MRHYNIFILNILTYIFSIYGNNIAYKKKWSTTFRFFSLFFYGNGELIDLLDCVNIRINVFLNCWVFLIKLVIFPLKKKKRIYVLFNILFFIFTNFLYVYLSLFWKEDKNNINYIIILAVVIALYLSACEKIWVNM